MITTFIGRDQTKNVRENLELVKEIWPPIIKLAEVCDVKIAIENCPMLFGEEQWRRTESDDNSANLERGLQDPGQ